AHESTVADDVLDTLASLVDKSLVARDEHAGATRYRLAETVRDYAREKLLERDSSTTLRDRHLRHYLRLAEEARPNLQSAGQAAWLDRLEGDHDNLRGALEWCLGSGAALEGMRLCGDLQRFWIARGHHSEGRAWCERLLAADSTSFATAERAMALNCAGLLAYQQGDLATASMRFEERLAICRALGDRRAIAISLNNLGMVALERGDVASAGTFHEESLGIARELGNRNGIGRSLGNLGMIAHKRQDLGEARRLFEESLVLMRELGDREGIGVALHCLGGVAMDAGDFTTACRRYSECLAILRELGHRLRIAYSLQGLADVLAMVGPPERAAMLWGAAERLLEELGSRPTSSEAAEGTRIAVARGRASDGESFDRAWAAGRMLSLQQALDIASDAATASGS
ncbi:MAG TPA: tetratricopeptide repeat protein, partial [Casimicrobiaceae bacterium]|nr:tetratricopeptide repeat protein [Casimicrobiaceae bacterium]